MGKNLLVCITYEGLQKLGIHYDYEDLVKKEQRGHFPKQVMPRLWIAEQVLEWRQANFDRLPPKLD